MMNTLADIYQRVAKQQLKLVDENISRFTKQLQQLSQVKKPEEFLELQSKFFQENTDAVAKQFQTLLEASLANVDKFTSACERTTSATMKKEKERAA